MTVRVVQALMIESTLSGLPVLGDEFRNYIIIALF